MTNDDKKTGRKIITLASGKGGVGKSAVAVNLAIALSQFGIRVLVLDADFGLANIDMMLGVQMKYNLGHFLRGEKRFDEIVHIGYDGVRFISGGSGTPELLKMDEAKLARIMRELVRLDMPVDYVLCDVGAGLGESTVQMLLASTETVIVTTPEPTAILDAYALMKTVLARDAEHPFRVIINRAENRREAERVLDGFRDMLYKNLDRDIDCLGFIMEDAETPRSVKRQTPIMISSPTSGFARDVRAVARELLELPPVREPTNIISKWLSRFAGS
jgi:flagellar biosynthesis protein FlhG